MLVRLCSLPLLGLLLALPACDSAPTAPRAIDPAENSIRLVGSMTPPVSFVGDRTAPTLQSLFETDYGQITYLTTTSDPEVVSVSDADTVTPSFEAVAVGEAVITVTATAPSGGEGQTSGTYDVEVVVKPECPGAADPARDIFPNDHVPSLGYDYRSSYSSPSSSSLYGGTLDFTSVTDECARGVRDLTMTGTVRMRRIVDGEEQGDPQTSSAALRFVITESDVSVSYSAPASSSPLYVFDGIDRAAPSGETVLVERVMSGCEGSRSKVWFTPGMGFERMAGGCRTRGPGSGNYITQTFSIDRR